MRIFHGTFVVAAALAVWAIGGCGEGGGGGSSKSTLRIAYDRPAEIDISAKFKQLAVQEFNGSDEQDKRWGQVASDKLSSDLETANAKDHRFVLVDRMGLKKILDERDLQTAFSSPEQAAKHAGALKTVDAIIYGSVKTSAQERSASKTSFDFASQRPKTVEYTKLYCQAIVNFTMVDVATGSTLATQSITENYDSDRDDKKGFFSSVMGNSGLKPSDQCLEMLIGKAVDKFVAKISPHQQVFEERLAKGKSKLVSTGNKLAVEGDTDGALDYYLRAIELKPEDDGAMFNAGLIYELKGDFAKASKQYQMAFDLKDDVRYAQARARVRDLAKNSPPAATQPVGKAE